MSALHPRVFRVGADTAFTWDAPSPIDSAEAVTLAVGAFSAAMAQLVADVTIVAGGISADRTVLTASAGPVVPDDFYKFGDAFLITDEDGSIPVRVTRINGTSILLAQPLPRSIALTATATLQFATWSTAIGSGDVTAAADYLGTEWSIAYTDASGDDAFAQGLVQVTRVVWQSGLTTASLIRRFPDLAIMAHGTTDYSDRIAAAYIELATRIDQDIASYTMADGQRATVNSVQSQAPALEQVHAYHTASMILWSRGDTEAAQAYFARAYGPETGDDLRRKTGLYAEAMRPIWVDLDKDGEIDDGEEVAVTGPRAAFQATGFPTTPRATMTRTR